MRKRILLLSLTLLLAALPALAEVYSGVTVASETIAVTARSESTIDEVCVSAGGIITDGGTAVTLRTQKVFATQEGTIAEISDDESSITLAPLSKYYVYCTVSEARAVPETMLVHSGETVYMKCTANGTHWAEGRVTLIDGEEYRVETTGGELYIGETVYLYRSADFDYDGCVGIGTVVSTDPETYDISGDVVRMCVTDGEYVQRGELLCEVAPEGGAEITSDADGIVLSVNVESGQQVRAGDVLMTVAPTDGICVQISVEESVAATLQAGDRVEIVYASDADEQVVGGTITEISAVADDDGYSVRIMPDEVPAALGLRADVRV